MKYVYWINMADNPNHNQNGELVKQIASFKGLRQAKLILSF